MGNYIYIYIHQKNMFILNIFIYKKIIIKYLKKSSRYHSCSNVWNSENSNAFSDILLDNFIKCVNLGNIFFKWNLFIFIWTKYEKDNNGQSWVLLFATKDDVK
jgi:hypothetical protein